MTRVVKRIVDMRLRPPLPTWTKKSQFNRGPEFYERHQFSKPKSADAQSMELLLREMDEMGIECGVIMGRQSAEPSGAIPNDELADCVSRYPSRFVAWAGIDLARPMDWCLEEIRRCAKIKGFKGISIEPTVSRDLTLRRPDERRLYPIYEECMRLELPVNVTLSGVLQPQPGRPYEDSYPIPLYRVAKDFPKLQIHVAHGAWPWVMEMIGIAFVCPNVWLSADEYLVQQIPGAGEYFKAANNYFSDRTVFGSSYPSRPIDQMVNAYMAWEWSEAVVPKIMRENALRLMRMV
jgi:predicted TIM-barrel fold metal-dependent hydrolase